MQELGKPIKFHLCKSPTISLDKKRSKDSCSIKLYEVPPKGYRQCVDGHISRVEKEMKGAKLALKLSKKT